jgi:Mrp family chromosome partitioning ATPase/uncharacterized protein involved in exopolysaccharide biosynthesis
MAEQESGDLTFARVRDALRRHKLAAVFTLLGCIAIAGTYSALSTPLYEGRASILIQTKSSNILWESRYMDDIKAQQVLAMSKPVLERSIELARQRDPEVVPYLDVIGSFKVVISGQLLVLRVLHPVAKDAALLCNAWLDANVDEISRRERAATDYTRDFLGAEVVPDLRKSWMTKQEKLQSFIREKNIDAKEFEQHPIRQTYAEVSKQINETKWVLGQLEREARAWLEAKDDLGMLMLQPRARLDETVRVLAKDLRAAQQQVIDQEQRYDAGSRFILREREQLSRVQGALADVLRLIHARLQFDLQVAREDFEALNKQFAEVEKQYETLKANIAQMQSMSFEADVARNQYEALSKRQAEAELSGRVTYSSVQAWERSTVTDRPVSPNWPRNLGLGGALGFLLAGLLAVFLEKIDDTVRSPGQIEKTLGIQVIGSVPHLGRRWQHQTYNLAVEHAAAPPVESLRMVKNALQVGYGGTNGRGSLVQITSPNPGEGKSFFSNNLAHLFSLGGKRVLLVDADRHRFSLSRFHKMEGQPGLADILEGKTSLDQVLLPAPIGRSWLFMSPGSGAGHVSIFEHPRFPQLAEDLRRRFDYVIFDGAPVLAVGDPTILAAQTDLSLLIARGRQTRLAQLDRAFEMLNKAKAPTCLCVLNGMTAGDAEMDGYATGAGYAYAYGYRGRNPNRETDRVPQPQ